MKKVFFQSLQISKREEEEIQKEEERKKVEFQLQKENEEQRPKSQPLIYKTQHMFSSSSSSSSQQQQQPERNKKKIIGFQKTSQLNTSSFLLVPLKFNSMINGKNKLRKMSIPIDFLLKLYRQQDEERKKKKNFGVDNNNNVESEVIDMTFEEKVDKQEKKREEISFREFLKSNENGFFIVDIVKISQFISILLNRINQYEKEIEEKKKKKVSNFISSKSFFTGLQGKRSKAMMYFQQNKENNEENLKREKVINESRINLLIEKFLNKPLQKIKGSDILQIPKSLLSIFQLCMNILQVKKLSKFIKIKVLNLILQIIQKKQFHLSINKVIIKSKIIEFLLSLLDDLLKESRKKNKSDDINSTQQQQEEIKNQKVDEDEKKKKNIVEKKIIRKRNGNDNFLVKIIKLLKPLSDIIKNGRQLIIENQGFEIFMEIISDFEKRENTCINSSIILIWDVLEYAEEKDLNYFQEVENLQIIMRILKRICRLPSALTSIRSKDMRNDLYVISEYLAKNPKNFIDTGFLDYICEFFINEQIVKEPTSMLLKSGKREKSVSQDFEFFKLNCDLFSKLLLLDEEVEKIVVEKNMIKYFVNYIDLTKQNQPHVIKWNDGQIVEIWESVMQILFLFSEKNPCYLSEGIISTDGDQSDQKTVYQIILEFFGDYFNVLMTDNIKRRVVAVLLNIARNPTSCEKFTKMDDCLNIIIQNVLNDKNSTSIREYGLQIVSWLCTNYPEVFQDKFTPYVDSILNLLKFNRRVSTGSDDFTFFVIDCLWSAVYGNDNNESRFVQKNGVELLLNALELAFDWVRYPILSCLTDLLYNDEVKEKVLEWKSKVNGFVAVQLFIKIYEQKLVMDDNLKFRFQIEKSSLDFKQKVFHLCKLLDYNETNLTNKEKRTLIEIKNYDKILSHNILEKVEADLMKENIKPLKDDFNSLKKQKILFEESKNSIKLLTEQIIIDQEEKDRIDEMKLYHKITNISSSQTLKSLMKSRVIQPQIQPW